MARSACWYSALAAMASRSSPPTWGIKLWASASVKRLDMRIDSGCVMRRHITIHDIDEFGHNAIALEGSQQAPIHIDRGLGLLERARQRNAEIGVLRFAGAIHHA